MPKLGGALFVAAGIVCLCNWRGTLLSVAWLIGLLTLASGIASLFYYIDIRKFFPNGGFTLLSAIADILIGILYLGNQLTVAVILPYVFALWLLVNGIQAVIHSFDIKKAGYSLWWGTLCLGVIEALFAAFVFINPIAGAVAISILVGIALISRGLNRFALLAGVSKIKKALTTV